MASSALQMDNCIAVDKGRQGEAIKKSVKDAKDTTKYFIDENRDCQMMRGARTCCLICGTRRT